MQQSRGSQRVGHARRGLARTRGSTQGSSGTSGCTLNGLGDRTFPDPAGGRGPRRKPWPRHKLGARFTAGQRLDPRQTARRTSSSKVARLRPAHFGVKVPWAGDSILGTGPSLCYPPLSCLGCNSCSFPSFTGKIDPPNREGWKKPLERGGFAFYHLLTLNRSQGLLLVLITLPVSIPTRILRLLVLRRVLSPLVIQFQP